MDAVKLAALFNQAQKPTEISQPQIPIIINECPMDNEPVMDGTGPHLGLRAPWYNDWSHEVTDNTLFRILLICVVVEWVFKKFKEI